MEPPPPYESGVHSPLTRSPEPPSPSRRKSERTKLSHDFNRYEITVMATTQLSYIPIAASMLSTTFFKPSPEFCRPNSNGSSNLPEFHSLLFDWQLACSETTIVTMMSVSLMIGALIGAFLAGWLADLYGRAPVLKCSLLAVSVCNFILALTAQYFIWFTAWQFLLLGIFCGGYMVVNLVMFVECLELPRARLLAVSTNGWSISMIVVALIAWFSNHWRLYHLIVAAFALCAFTACTALLVESCRWLDSAQRSGDALRNALAVAKKNKHFVHPDWTWWEVLRFNSSAAHSAITDEDSSASGSYGFRDLFRSSGMYVLALTYCFIASSIVTFGFYFILDGLPGNRYINMIVMGASKFAFGWIPFAASFFDYGRRPIVISSVGVATVSAWIAVAVHLTPLPSGHWIRSVLYFVVCASLDPTWKILHLYSTELFPTAVRNMARGICNVGARLGSVTAPVVVYLRMLNFDLPLLVFTILLTLQLVIVFYCLPETKDKPLPSDLQQRPNRIDEMLEES